MHTAIRRTYSARTLHLKSTVNHVVNKFLDSFPLFRVLAVVHYTRMEISIANVPKDTCKQA